MSWRYFIPILDLICLVIELSDPTTPFVRIGTDINKNRHTVTQVHSGKSTDKLKISDVDRSEKSDSSQTPQSDYQLTVCHAAIEIRSFSLKVDWTPQEWAPINTGLVDQTYPTTLRRPPIA